MIRDPSDGSVKEKPVVASALAPASKEDQEYLKRLGASREWLKDYKARKASQWHAPGADSLTTRQDQLTTDEQPSCPVSGGS